MASNVGLYNNWGETWNVPLIPSGRRTLTLRGTRDKGRLSQKELPLLLCGALIGDQVARDQAHSGGPHQKQENCHRGENVKSFNFEFFHISRITIFLPLQFFIGSLNEGESPV